MYVNGIEIQGIEQVTDIHHNTIINWIREAKIELLLALEEDKIPEIIKISQLQTFVRKKLI